MPRRPRLRCPDCGHLGALLLSYVPSARGRGRKARLFYPVDCLDGMDDVYTTRRPLGCGRMWWTSHAGVIATAERLAVRFRGRLIGSVRLWHDGSIAPGSPYAENPSGKPLTSPGKPLRS